MTTSVIDTLIQRHAAFARERFSPSLRMMPSLKTLVLGCVDPRVDPAVVLGLEAGETAIIRNVGGRVTPSTFETLAMLRKVSQAAGGDLAAGWNLVVLHHTDCGIKRLHGSSDLLARFFELPAEGLETAFIDDPRLSVVRDIASLRAHPDVASEVTVSGLVYDVATGALETVVAPAPLRAPGS